MSEAMGKGRPRDAESMQRRVDLHQSLRHRFLVIVGDPGAGKVHLLGHSQAGLDFRVLLGGLRCRLALKTIRCRGQRIAFESSRPNHHHRRCEL